MPEFIVRARKAPVDPDRFLKGVGGDSHVEYLAHIIVNALLISKGHRDDSSLTLVLEDSKDFSRALTLNGSSLGSLRGTHEAALLQSIADALAAGRSLGKEQALETGNGIHVRTISFEHLVRERVSTSPVFMMARKGSDIRTENFANDPVFLLTDHIPMPKKTFKSLARLGVRQLSLGPKVLHASQCITLIHNELDRTHTFME